MPKYQKSLYSIVNKHKYIGAKTPIARSSWERTFMIFLDHNPSIEQWASEPFSIPYKDPITGKKKQYWPDFLILYVDKNGVKHGEIIEIKPNVQTGRVKTKSPIHNAQIIKNNAKWAAALQYCESQGLKFRLITELDMFKTGVKK